MLVVVGGQIDSGESKNRFLNDAQLTRLHLIKKGIQDNSISLVLRSADKYHYTYRSAVALKNWLSKSEIPLHFVDIYTIGVHSRKSYVTFDRVLSPDYQVGILSGKPLYYSPEYWYLSTKGIYLVYKNFFGYLYAKLLPFQLLE